MMDEKTLTDWEVVASQHLSHTDRGVRSLALVVGSLIGETRRLRGLFSQLQHIREEIDTLQISLRSGNSICPSWKYEIPPEIVESYKAGQRLIQVSPEVFKAYDDYITRNSGYLTRFSASLHYKDAKVQVVR